MHEPAPHIVLRAIRLQRGLSMRALAIKAGLQTSTVMRFEKDEVTPSVKTLLALSGALEIDPELIGGPSSDYGDEDMAGRIAEANDRLGAA